MNLVHPHIYLGNMHAAQNLQVNKRRAGCRASTQAPPEKPCADVPRLRMRMLRDAKQQSRATHEL